MQFRTQQHDGVLHFFAGRFDVSATIPVEGDSSTVLKPQLRNLAVGQLLFRVCGVISLKLRVEPIFANVANGPASR